jgi:hypothetical protein
VWSRPADRDKARRVCQGQVWMSAMELGPPAAAELGAGAPRWACGVVVDVEEFGNDSE